MSMSMSIIDFSKKYYSGLQNFNRMITVSEWEDFKDENAIPEWDYSLEEDDVIKDGNTPCRLVMFMGEHGGTEYRYCEIPSDMIGFVDDKEKMYDFLNLPKYIFLTRYSYLTEAEYNATANKFFDNMLKENGIYNGSITVNATEEDYIEIKTNGKVYYNNLEVNEAESILNSMIEGYKVRDKIADDSSLEKENYIVQYSIDIYDFDGLNSDWITEVLENAGANVAGCLGVESWTEESYWSGVKGDSKT